MELEVDRAAGNGDVESCPYRPRHQADIAAVRVHQLGGDGKPEASTARAGRALECLEQMGARLFRHALAGIRHLDHHYATFAPASDEDLIAGRIARPPRFPRPPRGGPPICRAPE